MTRTVNAATQESSLTEFETKRRAILDGASRVFATRGFTAGTTREIAATVQLTQPAIYHYVGAKADLLREIALQVTQELESCLEAGLNSSDDPAEQLRAIIHEYTAAVARNQYPTAVYWQEAHSLPDDIRAHVQQRQRNFIANVSMVVARLQDQGRLPAGPASVVARAVLSMPTWLYQWYRPGRGMTTDAISDLFCQLISLESAT